jgi:hypothetical protein
LPVSFSGVAFSVALAARVLFGSAFVWFATLPDMFSCAPCDELLTPMSATVPVPPPMHPHDRTNAAIMHIRVPFAMLHFQKGSLKKYGLLG